MAPSILEFSKTSLQLQVESKKVLKQLKQKEISVQELSQSIRFLEQTHLSAKEVIKILKLAKKYDLSTQSLERTYKAYTAQEKCVPALKKQLKRLGLKEITILPNLISARGKNEAYVSIHVRKPPIVNGFPAVGAVSGAFNDYIQDLERKLKTIMK